jgi:hypothetical protein
MRERKYYAIKKSDELLGFLVTELHDDSELHKSIVPLSHEYVNLLQSYDDVLMEKFKKGELSEEEVRPVVETEHVFIVENTRYKKLGDFVYYVILLYAPIPSYYVSNECKQIAYILNEEIVDFYFSKEQAVKSLERKEKLVSTYKDKCEQKLLLEISKDVKFK